MYRNQPKKSTNGKIPSKFTNIRTKQIYTSPKNWSITWGASMKITVRAQVCRHSAKVFWACWKFSIWVLDHLMTHTLIFTWLVENSCPKQDLLAGVRVLTLTGKCEVLRWHPLKWVRTTLMSIPALHCSSQLLDLRSEMRDCEKSYHSLFSLHLLSYDREYQSTSWVIWCLYPHCTFLGERSVIIPNLVLHKSSDPGYSGQYLQKVLKSLAPIQAPLLQELGSWLA